MSRELCTLALRRGVTAGEEPLDEPHPVKPGRPPGGAMIRSRAALAVCAAAALATVAAGCGSSSSSSSSAAPAGGTSASTQAVKKGGILRIGTINGYDSMNPFVAYSAQSYDAFIMQYPTLV